MRTNEKRKFQFFNHLSSWTALKFLHSASPWVQLVFLSLIIPHRLTHFYSFWTRMRLRWIVVLWLAVNFLSYTQNIIWNNNNKHNGTSGHIEHSFLPTTHLLISLSGTQQEKDLSFQIEHLSLWFNEKFIFLFFIFENFEKKMPSMPIMMMMFS
jgi:hypothetical protein